MVLRNFEDRLERLVEGMFARAFRSGLQPVEIGRRLVKDLDGNQTLDVHGRRIAPNRFDVRLAPKDYSRFAQIQESLVSELKATLRDRATDEEVRFLGPIAVTMTEDQSLTVGIFRVEPTFDESTPGTGHGAQLELPDGQLVELGQGPATIGRIPESTVVLADPNASRNHAELRVAGDSYELIDLGSTNGSRVNGHKVARQLLQDGDELTFGTVKLQFRLS